jgi:hypothetical protein
MENFLIPCQGELSQASHWERVYVFGTYPIAEVLRCVKNAYWQGVRAGMLGTSLETKWLTLGRYLGDPHATSDVHTRHVQVTNYVYALKRGGLIK